MRFWSGQRPFGLRALSSSSIASSTRVVRDRRGEPQVVEAAEERVVPVPRVRQLGEPLGDDLARLSDRKRRCCEHELGRARLGVAEGRSGHRPLVDRDADVLEHVERRVKRAVRPVRVVPHVAVPAAVGELRAENRLGEREEPRIVRIEEVRGEPQPEAQVAQVDALEQGGAVHFLCPEG